jgi:calcineurin-like phosphoesterase family protein
VNVWFTSDPHWGHRLVATLRGFDDVADHDAALLDTFQGMIKPDDQVWWLGDLAMNNPANALLATRAIPGHHHLITGNHDRCNPGSRDAHKHQRAYLEVFESVQAFARRRIGDTPTLLSHYPYSTGDGEADHGEVRYEQYRLPDRGAWLLHGHTHNADQRLHGKQIHVGLDAWDLQPVHVDTVAALVHGV